MISVTRSNCQVCSSLDHYSQNTSDFCTPNLNSMNMPFADRKTARKFRVLNFSAIFRSCCIASGKTYYAQKGNGNISKNPPKSLVLLEF